MKRLWMVVGAVGMALFAAASADASTRQYAGQGSHGVHIVFQARFNHGEPIKIQRFTYRVGVRCDVGGWTRARGHLRFAMHVNSRRGGRRFWGRANVKGRHVHVRGHFVEGRPDEVAEGILNLHGRVNSRHSNCATGRVTWFAIEGRGPKSVHYTRCRPGRHLKGSLQKHHVPCHKARRIFRMYFPQSHRQPGATTTVLGFACFATQETPRFHIRCHHRAPNGGLRRTKFVGVPK